MKNYFHRLSTMLQSICRARHLAIPILIFLSLACEKNLLQESNSRVSSQSARLASQPIFTTSYEIEAFSMTQILSKFSQNSKDKAFVEIAAQPTLEKQHVEFRLFADGNYEMTTTLLDPVHVELLSASMQKKQLESVLPYKTLITNDVAHFYDRSGKETGKSQLKHTTFNDLSDRILKSREFSTGQVSNEIMGHPLINEAYIMNLAKEKNAEITEQRGITKVRFDLTRFIGEGNETAENLSKFSVQYYDFKNKRLLGERLYDKDGKTLLFLSDIFYTPVDKGNQIEKTSTESYEEDIKTGLKTRHIKQIFYSNVKNEVNI